MRQPTARSIPFNPCRHLPRLYIHRSKSVSDQLQEALDNGNAASVYIQLKHLSRVLHATMFTEPAQVLCGEPLRLWYGIADGPGACVYNIGRTLWCPFLCIT
ncbi:hypothetical protein Vafri_3679 [Volvox africanus]|uniref:Uncharacterized protein n=1 Tax=Volvox africanus TaxID=51714 RepID=A0A8J4EU54_9CHLO|nr:hypothetical protein Vafri_3679 [Volvox africanus]